MGLIKGWSPTRLEAYEACPLNAKLRYVDSLCTLCFKGRTTGGFDGKPVTCDACKRKQEPGAALVRGSRIGLSLEKYIKGQGQLDREILNLETLRLAASLKEAYARGFALVEVSVVLDSNWNPQSVYTKGAWFRGKLDVLLRLDDGELVVIDWKTGGVDKRTGEVRAAAKYDDQLSSYAVAALSADNAAKVAKTKLCFTDAGKLKNPIVERPSLTLRRENLIKEQKKWSLRVKPMLADEKFKPTPSADTCHFCPYKKSLGGPCPEKQ